MKFLAMTLLLTLFAASGFAASPYFFSGYVYLNGSIAPNGTIVEAYLNSANSPSNSAIVGEGQLADSRPGWYSISVVGNSGDTVAFRVNNLSLNSANGTNTSTQTLSGQIVGSAELPFNLSVNKSATGVSCQYAIGCSSGFCVDSYCCNSACGGTSEDCNVAGSLGTCTSTATTTTTGGGGGGGGAVTPSASETLTVASINAGATATVTVTNPASLGVETIVFTSSVSAANVQVTVKETTPAAASVSVAISSSEGAVYKYLEITKTGLQSSQMSSVKVNFKVPKSWLTSNKIDKNTVALNRYSNGWSKLPTTVRSEDSTYVYYAADTPGFSTFAITGEKAQAQPAPSAACGNNTREAGEECDGTDLAGETCESKGYLRGTLRCTNCRFDYSGCVAIPSFTIVSPSSGQTIYGTAVTVTFSVSGFTLAPATGAVVEGEGHLHLYLDNRPYVLSSTATSTFSDVPYGEHTLRAALHRGDHTEFSPAVERTVSFRTAPESERPQPTPTPEQPPAPDYTAGLVILLIIIIVGAAYMMTRKKK